MKYRKSYREVQDGYNVVNGRPHGFKWRPEWEVTYTFDSEEKMGKFIESIRRKGDIA